MESRLGRTLQFLLTAILAGIVAAGILATPQLQAAIRSSKIASILDSSDPSKIQPSDLDPTTLPASPVMKDIWYDSQDTYIAIKVYKGGAWREVARIDGDYSE